MQLEELCAKVGEAYSGNYLKLTMTALEFNSMDDLGETCWTIEFLPFLSRRHHQLESHGQLCLAPEESFDASRNWR